MSCIKVVVRGLDEHLRISANLVCSAQKPTLNYLMDSLGRKLYDISDKVLLVSKENTLRDRLGRNLYDIRGELLILKR